VVALICLTRLIHVILSALLKHAPQSLKQLENKMTHETENTIESTELIREIYELTHEATVGNSPAIRLRLEELYKEAELRGVM
jgi:hypothetical protein